MTTAAITAASRRALFRSTARFTGLSHGRQQQDVTSQISLSWPRGRRSRLVVRCPPGAAVPAGEVVEDALTAAPIPSWTAATASLSVCLNIQDSTVHQVAPGWMLPGLSVITL